MFHVPSGMIVEPMLVLYVCKTVRTHMKVFHSDTLHFAGNFDNSEQPQNLTLQVWQK